MAPSPANSCRASSSHSFQVATAEAEATGSALDSSLPKRSRVRTEVDSRSTPRTARRRFGWLYREARRPPLLRRQGLWAVCQTCGRCVGAPAVVHRRSYPATRPLGAATTAGVLVCKGHGGRRFGADSL